MKVNVKSLLKDSKFVELQNYIEQIKLDVFMPDSASGGVKFDKFKNTYSGIDACFKNNVTNFNSALLKIDELYNNYSADYSTKIEFVKEMFTCLKNELSKYILKSDNSLDSTQNSNYNYEDLRKEYLTVLKARNLNNLSLLLIENELKTQPISNLICFINYIETRVAEVKNKYSNADRQSVLIDTLDCQRDSTITTGNLLISQKINVKTDVFQPSNPKSTTLLPLLHVCTFLLNYLNLENTGLLAKDIGFDGYSFFNIKTVERVRNNTMILHQTNLSNAERSLQSNFVVNEEFAMALLNVYKKHIKIRRRDALIYNETENGEQFKVIKTLFKPQFCKSQVRNSEYKYNLNLGYFVKVKRINLTKNNFEIMLYYYCDDQLKHGIQLFRADKVDAVYKGMPASHILRGGEKLFTSMHLHLYNVIDATLKNPDKDSSLGAMDVAYNFINQNNITLEMAEEFFNQSCGIYNRALEETNEKTFSS